MSSISMSRVPTHCELSAQGFGILNSSEVSVQECYHAGIFSPFLNDFHFCYLCIQLHFTFVSHFKNENLLFHLTTSRYMILNSEF